MKKSLILLVGMLFLVAACSSDKSKTDNENLPDDQTPTDESEVADDTSVVTDDATAIVDDLQPEGDDVVTDEIITDEIVTDEIVTDEIATDEDQIATDELLTDSDTIEPITGLIFSEYIHGSGNNKGFEIYNAAGETIDLAICEVRVYKDGSATATSTIALTGEVTAGDVYVVCHTNFTDKTNCDLLENPGFNGNDSLELVCGGVTLDVFGQIGSDPGTEWGTGDVTTANHTLRRKCGITEGDADGSDAFDPATEWDGYPLDTFDGLGVHTTECAAVPPVLLDNYDGTDDLTYVTDGTWAVSGGLYEGAASGLSTPEHSYASYDLTQSITGWSLDTEKGNAWFGWLFMNRNNGVTGWGTDNFSMALILAADNGDLNDAGTAGYGVGFKDTGALVVFRFDAGITDATNALPGTATELADSGYVYANTDGGVNVFVEQGSDGKWTIHYLVGAPLSDMEATDKANYTGGTVTSTVADETYAGATFKYAGWVYAHGNSANHKARFDNFGAGMAY